MFKIIALSILFIGITLIIVSIVIQFTNLEADYCKHIPLDQMTDKQWNECVLK